MISKKIIKKPKKQIQTRKPSEKKKDAYTAKDIYVLEGLDPVRKRPAMYIGGTGSDGLHHLIWECVDNSLDEAIAGYANNIEISLLSGNRIKTADNGRGIPVDRHPQTKKSALETVMTTLHAGAKFGSKAYQISGGLHGVGVSVVCALSNFLRAEVCRDGVRYMQEYSKGKTKSKMNKLGSCKETGTTIIFEPDPEIFKDIKFDSKKIVNHLRQQAYLTKGVRITIRDERMDKKKEYGFYFEGGLKSYVRYLIRGSKPIQENIFCANGEKDGILVEAAFQFANERETYEESFANNIWTKEGGTHLTGFRSMLTRTLNDYAKKNNYLKDKEDTLSGEDVREGLTAVVSVKLKDPQFEGQTKAKLGNPEAKTAVEAVVSEDLIDFLERNPHDSRAIIENCLLSQKARKAAKAARQTILRKGTLEGLALPGKLADCSSRNPEESEIYIVEGDSAGGCFFKDTEVALVDGRNLSFRELEKEDNQGKKNYCYTVKNDGNIGIGLIENPRKTRKNVEVIKVILDNKKEIICTPDHKFMLRNGSYKEAIKLSPQDSLMPLRRQLSKLGKQITIEGYELVYNNKQHRWIFTHILADEYNLINNIYPDKENSHRHHIDFNKLNNNPGLEEAVLNYNHKIKKIIKLSQKIDVYDLEVKGTHNFALGCGIFVHNSGKQARDRHFQAILPLRGKILNVERAHLDKILASKEIKSLIIALGTAVADDFNLDKLRYHRIIIMTDADVDGSHIQTLLLTLFYRYFPEIIEKGYLYIAQPPLYKIQVGKRKEYAYTDEDKEEILLDIKEGLKKTKKAKGVKETKDEKKIIGVNIQRYKGLGEMNPEELWETTMNPKNRVLLKINIEDAKEADRTFDTLMGGEVYPRKRFIQTYAKEVKNLDI